jgi:predicted DCC family thiol-disulfide oxidoreductase YuxK
MAMKSPENQTENQIIVFYDGVCALCNSSVKWLISTDKKRRLKYAPLQGETAKNLIDSKSRESLHSLVLWTGGKIYQRSEAFFEIVKIIGGFNRFWLIFSVFPTSWCNVVYDFVARNRYRWFGKYESCPIPKPEVRELFLE